MKIKIKHRINRKFNMKKLEKNYHRNKLLDIIVNIMKTYIAPMFNFKRD